MPEGDTVFHLAERLRPALVGAALQRTEFRVPAFADVSLAGLAVSAIETRGKHLLMRVADATIWSHLRMEGRWRTYGPGDRWTAPAHTARCILETDRHEAVGFELGLLRVLPSAHVDEQLAWLGPDPLGDWYEDRAAANLRAQGDRALGLALLDQSVIAGLGNVYRNEVCFLSRVHPDTPVAAMSDDELRAVVRLSARLLVLNSHRYRRNTTGGIGEPSSFVYGRSGKPCLRCRTRIERGTLGDPALLAGRVGGDGLEPVERVIAWCPRCQPRR